MAGDIWGDGLSPPPLSLLASGDGVETSAPPFTMAGDAPGMDQTAPPMTMSASGIWLDYFVNTVSPYTMSADFAPANSNTFPVYTMAADFGWYADIPGSNDLPPYTLAAAGVGGDVIAVELTPPIYEMVMSILTGEMIGGDNERPPHTLVADFGWFMDMDHAAHDLNAAAIVGSISSAGLTFPLYQLSALGISTTFATGSSQLPAYVVSMTGVTGGVGQAALLLPARELEALGFVSAVAVMALQAPVYALVSIGFSAFAMSFAETLPAYQLDALQSQAVVAAFRAWVLNLRKKALTEYTNFAFNSFAVCDDRVFAAGPTGIFELAAQDTDAGAAISAVVRTGQHDFGTSFAKRVPRIYMGHSATGALEFRTITAADATRAYLLPWNQTSAVQLRRVPINRGPKSTYWQFEVANRDGADFLIDKMQLYPEKTHRRVS